jgi:GNAT superfamily N-acetyltransferase
MSIEVSIDNFDMSQFDNLATLFGSYFKPNDKLLTKDYTEWLYARNPFGPAKMVKAVEGGRWIGFMAMIPVQLVRRDARLVAYYVVNVLVHPQYQGKHIFGRLITAAKELVKAENAALMGHPNDMALKQWQRSRMNFHEALKPSLVVPKLFSKGVNARVVQDAKQLNSVLPALQAQAQQSDRLNIAVTQDYINWRYLERPANNYRVQLIEVDGVPAGFVFSKKVRIGLSLLVDQFMLNQHVPDGLSRLPWFTVSFKPESSTRELSKSLRLLPIKKQIPFFFTHFQQTYSAHDVMYLGLSASDI